MGEAYAAWQGRAAPIAGLGFVSGLFSSLLRPALFSLDAERAHALSIQGLKSGLIRPLLPRPDPRLAIGLAGLTFPSPVGMAAGYDKNAEVPDALLRLGFGFVEIGTVTPLPQPGNPKPRIFRLISDRAVINRFGFNSKGHEAVLAKLEARAQRPGIVGVNIGANKDSANRIDDYVLGIRKFYALASYFCVNISSPNTQGLRGLQARQSLAELLIAIKLERANGRSRHKRNVPVFLKIAPDLSEAELDDIAGEVAANGVDGIIISNTTLERAGLASKAKAEMGGLSGAPLFERSTIMLAKMRKRVGPKMPLIGAGGVDSAATALAKIEAGADLVQLYTGMIYQGPGLAAQIVRGLSKAVSNAGAGSVTDLRGRRLDEWAAKPIPD
jgi:dihydroorotate dehydrogenase